MEDASEPIVVTGGGGFIGNHLVRHLLLTTNAPIVVFDRAPWTAQASVPPQLTRSRLIYTQGDVRDEEALFRAMKGACLVFHLAACGGEHDLPGWATNVFTTNDAGTHAVLSAALRSQVRRVLFPSSYEVYGEPADLPVDETHPLLAPSCFAASKAAAEAHCRAFRREFGLDTVVLRLTEVYGRGGSGDIAQWLAEAAAGRTLEVHGDRSSDFVWVGDVVDALVRAARVEGSLPTINVGSGTGVRHVDIARRIVAASGSHSQVSVLSARDLRPSRFVASIRRMQQLLDMEAPLDPLAYVEQLARDGATTESQRNPGHARRRQSAAERRDPTSAGAVLSHSELQLTAPS